MKKNLLLFYVIIAISSWSCSNESDSPIDQCVAAQANTATALQNFNAVTEADANYESICNTYKNVLQAQITACGDETGSIQTIIDGLGDCLPSTSQGSITVTVGTLARTYDQNVSVNQNGNTLTIRAEESGGDWISFDVEQGQTGTDIINANFILNTFSRDYTPTTSPTPFTSSITVNSSTNIEGTFSGTVLASSNGSVLSLTSGVINITY